MLAIINSPPNTSNREILSALYEGGRLRTVKVTFPEGLSIEEISDLLDPIKTDKTRFLELAYSDSLLKTRGIESGNVLGYLLPNTYEFFLYEKAENVIDRMLDANKNIWDKKNRIKLDQINLTKHQVITLASIVEAETPLKSEASIVAGLYQNRLKIGMRLQADPTIQYVLGRKKRVLYRDLEIDNPYNTYLYTGLPPGPINNPGKRSIESVLNPAQHNYLFMVAKGDGSGKHYFSETNSQHMSYVNKYRNTRDSIKQASKL
ncbi:endolytic transglycosylase MltG [Candidatus Kapabacteria bacterium]|nr:endolytic transglycosylase MltG [Candidatus Kapabacteria bacterium]